MRTIKLRAWSKLDNPKLKFVLKEIDYELWFVMENDEQIKYTFSAVYLDDDWIKEQSTGLFDKNGVEIYEGDILRVPPKNKWEETNFVAYEVFFHDNDCADRHIGFQMNRPIFYGSIMGTSSFYSFLPKNTNKMEVIGNIHDKGSKYE